MISRWWVLGLAAAVVAGVWLAGPLLALAGVLGLLLAGAELLWTRHCLTGVEYERRLGASHALWGDEVSLTVRLANRKPLPLTWLQTEDRVPDRLAIEPATLTRGLSESLVYLSNLLPMLPYEQVVRRYRVRCRQRGLFEFGPGRVESGDLLGYASRSVSYPRVDRLIVYPRLFELVIPALRSRRIVGRQATDRVIMTDPSRTVGVRRYQPGDPLRHVEWRATARSRDLLVRVFEPTTDLALAVFLDFRVLSLARGNLYPDELEFAISLAASLARWALERGCRVGVFGNGSGPALDGVRVPVGDAPDQLRHILETLALATPFGWRRAPIAHLLAAEAPGLPFEASVATITAAPDEQLLAALSEIGRRRPATLLHVRTPEAPEVRMERLDIVTVPYERSWQDLDRIQLAG